MWIWIKFHTAYNKHSREKISTLREYHKDF